MGSGNLSAEIHDFVDTQASSEHDASMYADAFRLTYTECYETLSN